MTTTILRTGAAASERRRKRPANDDGRPGGLRRTPYSYAALILLAIFAALPVLVLVLNSFKSDAEIGANPLGFPQTWDFSNFSTAWTLGRLGQGMLNSALIVGGTIVGVWVCAGMASYALARLRVPFKRGITFYLLLVISLPVQMFVVPLFFLWTSLNQG